MVNPIALVHHTVLGFIEDEALTRGAAIAFYTATSIGPLLFIVIAIAGVIYGQDAAKGAILAQLGGTMGHDSASLLQDTILSAEKYTSGVFALIGVGILVITVSGVMSEMQHALNVIWKAVPEKITVTGWLRTRAIGLSLVGAVGFLLIVSLVISTVLSVLSNYINEYLPYGYLILQTVTYLVSFGLTVILFGAIYKILPSLDIPWHDVLIGSVVTALLLEVGKYLIGLYLAHSTTASAYGAAGSLIIVLLWIYYSAQIFLFGAEFTKVYAAIRDKSATSM